KPATTWVARGSRLGEAWGSSWGSSRRRSSPRRRSELPRAAWWASSPASVCRPESASRWTTRSRPARPASLRSTTTATPRPWQGLSGTPSARRSPRSTRRRRRSSRPGSRKRRQGWEVEPMTNEQTDRGFVVVTGTSTGIGAATALRLAENGFDVFAGVRRVEDGEALKRQTLKTLTPLIIDVTEETTIAEAAEAVAEAVGERGLTGLVNNAGIGVPAPVEFQPMADFRRQLEVN